MVQLKFELTDGDVPQDLYIKMRVGTYCSFTRASQLRAVEMPDDVAKGLRNARLDLFRHTGGMLVPMKPMSEAEVMTASCMDGSGCVHLKVGIVDGTGSPDAVIEDVGKPDVSNGIGNWRNDHGSPRKFNPAQDYMQKHNLEWRLQDAIEAVLRERPEDPTDMIMARLQATRPEHPLIQQAFSKKEFATGNHYDLLVLGAGPAGVKVAIQAAARGQRVGLIEPQAVISGAPTGAHSKCLREAALHGAKTFAECENYVRLAFASAAASCARELHTFSVERMQGFGRILDPTKVQVTFADGGEAKEFSSDAIVIATGSKANRFPPTPFDADGVYDSDTIQSLSRIPSRMVVQGAGIVGLEYALIFAKLGAKVTVVEPFSKVVPMLDSALQQACLQVLQEANVDILLETPIKAVTIPASSKKTAPKLIVELPSQTIECDCILSATGRHGCSDNIGLETLEPLGLKVGRGKMIQVDGDGYTGVGKVYAVGDCAGANLATVGEAQALRVARLLFGSGMIATEKGMLTKPYCVWTIPELAWAGLNEEECTSKGIDFGMARVEYDATIRGCISPENGFLKMLFDKSNGKVIGVHIFGEHASDLINYGAELVNDEHTIFDILQFVFPAVTYHMLYHHVATKAKMRLKGRTDLRAATAWNKVRKLVVQHLGQSVEDLDRAFRIFDDDSSGVISSDNMKRALKDLGITVDHADIMTMIHEATGDEKADYIDYETFINMIQCESSDPETSTKQRSLPPSPTASQTVGRRSKRSSTMAAKTALLAAKESNEYDLIVLGAGPAGKKAATEAASRGRRVAIIEMKEVVTGAPTGTYSKCLREAVMNGAKTWEECEIVIDEAVQRAAGISARDFMVTGANLLRGTAKFTSPTSVMFKPSDADSEDEDDFRELKSKVIIIATGSRANRFPPVPFDAPGVYDSDTINNLSRLPKKMVVQGAGIIGLEYALIFAKLGAKVTVVEFAPKVVPSLDLALQAACLKVMKAAGIEIILSTPIKAVNVAETSTEESPDMVVDIGEGRLLECDCLLAAVGRMGNTKDLGLEHLLNLGLNIGRGKMIETNEDGFTGCGQVYAVGDVAGGGLATIGQAQALRCVRKVFGSGMINKEKGTKVKPFGVWTIPELAWVGQNEQEVEATGLNYGSVVVDYIQCLKGCVTQEEGFLKLVYNRSNGKILGVHIFGENACDIINFGGDLINNECTIFEMGNFIFPAVTYHGLYHLAATEAKLRLRGARDLRAATTWQRVKSLVTKQMGTDEDALHKAFELFDTDKKGFLSIKNMRSALNSLGVTVTEEDAQMMIREAAGMEGATELDYKTFLQQFKKL